MTTTIPPSAAKGPAADTTDPSARRVPLEGASNFRDLGGYRTADGRRVKWKHLYRSDALSTLTDGDLERIRELNLRHVFDLRDVINRQRQPNRPLRGTCPEVHELSIEPYRNEEMMSGISAGTVSAPETFAWVHEMYLRLMDEAAFPKLLHTLARPPAFPALIHCTSGKDRTGFAVALVLSALGVPRATVIEDFMLSNVFRKDIRYLFSGEVQAELLHTLSGVQQTYLDGVLDHIDATWGSMDNYLQRGLGLTASARLHLQETLLES